MTAEEKIEQANFINRHVNTMIVKTFDLLADIYKNRQEGITPQSNNNEEKCRLIYPCYSNEACRISEQELRFAFVEIFNRYCDLEGLPWLYSVETPTMNTYFFSKGKKAGQEPFPRQDDKGESANFDFVIHDQNLKRICLIEFKALNADKSEHQKDLLKLIKDHEVENLKNKRYYDYTQRYFIEILSFFCRGIFL